MRGNEVGDFLVYIYIFLAGWSEKGGGDLNETFFAAKGWAVERSTMTEYVCNFGMKE